MTAFTPGDTPRPPEQGRLTHLDEAGAARMVDVSAKDVTARTARASGRVLVSPAARTPAPTTCCTPGSPRSSSSSAACCGAP
ncbi:hypothetical protein ACFWF5_31055, partial [Streptomyces diastaticus]